MAEENVAQGDTEAGDNQATTQTQTDTTTAATTETPAGSPEQGLLGDQKTEANVDEGLLGKQEQDAVKAPEEYSEFTAPEGINGWQPDDLAEFKDVAKSENLSQEEAQKSFNVASKLIDKLVKESQEADEKFRSEQAELWKQTKDSDKNTVLAQEALDKRPDLKRAAVERGYLHDATFVGLLAELGRLESEAKSLTGDTAGQTGNSRLYTHEGSQDLYK